MSERQKLTGAPLVIKKNGKYTGVKEALRQSQPFGGELLGIEFFKMGSFRVVFFFSSNVCMCPHIWNSGHILPKWPAGSHLFLRFMVELMLFWVLQSSLLLWILCLLMLSSSSRTVWRMAIWLVMHGLMYSDFIQKVLYVPDPKMFSKATWTPQLVWFLFLWCCPIVRLACQKPLSILWEVQRYVMLFLGIGQAFWKWDFLVTGLELCNFSSFGHCPMVQNLFGIHWVFWHKFVFWIMAWAAPDLSCEVAQAWAMDSCFALHSRAFGIISCFLFPCFPPVSCHTLGSSSLHMMAYQFDEISKPS